MYHNTRVGRIQLCHVSSLRIKFKPKCSLFEGERFETRSYPVALTVLKLSMDQAGLELIAIHLSLPLKCATIPGLNAFLISKAQVAHYFWACVRHNLKSSVVLAGKFYMQN